MPFTFCHPAIILPLNKFGEKRISLTGLVIGSIVPDFEYFIRMSVYSKYSHTVSGVFYFDLPLALLLTFIFHYSLRTKLIINLPQMIRSRWENCRDFKWMPYVKHHWIVVIYSILLGTCSHLLWDSFTHSGGYFVSKIQLLQGNIFLFGHPLPGYKIAQHLSSFAGFIIIAGAVYSMPAEKVSKRKGRWRYWFFIFLCAGLIVLFRMSAGGGWSLGNLTVSAIAAILLSMVIIPSIPFAHENSVIRDQEEY
ncbi:MAG: DUF4184 domain-containing protein [Flavobacterium psychrophilum]|nr:MAG: DUF4184 domain-containing protein [Flavobacterium psychrophilum]